jgi:hypothetical protein
MRAAAKTPRAADRGTKLNGKDVEVPGPTIV